MSGADEEKEALISSKDETPKATIKPGKERTCCTVTPQMRVWFSHALSAWGDRMWEFAVALYLVQLTPGSLQLTAIFQFVRSMTLIILGPFVGNWVDRSPRLRVAQISLIAQNLSIAVSAVLLLLALVLELPYYAFVLIEAGVIAIACLSVLASVATTVAVEKDWVVVIAGEDKALLAGINSVMRRIDLVCKILAPALVGQVMTYASKISSVILIAGWNVAAVFLEYYLLWKAYVSVPALAIKKMGKEKKKERNEEKKEENAKKTGEEESGGEPCLENQDGGNPENPVKVKDGDEETMKSDESPFFPKTEIKGAEKSKKRGCCSRVRDKLNTLKNSWKVYMQQSVARPGIALAMLYFTVIAFGSITTAYLYTQRLTESTLSILRGVGSLFGVMATFAFPRFRNRCGLVRTGLFSTWFQFTCILCCLFAVFAPGSPFFLLPESWRYHEDIHQQNITVNNCTTNATGSPNSFTSSQLFQVLFPPSYTLQEQYVRNCTLMVSATTKAFNFSYISVILLLIGIITSRFGLWLTDLSITQLQQETVPEDERGKVGAVQRSLNSICEMLMYIFVITLPKPEQFGIMALMSVAAVGSGAILYATFACKVRGLVLSYMGEKGVSIWTASSGKGQASDAEVLTDGDKNKYGTF